MTYYNERKSMWRTALLIVFVMLVLAWFCWTMGYNLGRFNGFNDGMDTARLIFNK